MLQTNPRSVFFPNDHRVGFRKQRKDGGVEIVDSEPFWCRKVFVIVIFIIVIPCRQDAILTTQRKFDIKISIDKVKVRLLTLSLAHVSHFFSHMLQSVHCR